jgi:hypothetical protein
VNTLTGVRSCVLAMLFAACTLPSQVTHRYACEHSEGRIRFA